MIKGYFCLDLNCQNELIFTLNTCISFFVYLLKNVCKKRKLTFNSLQIHVGFRISKQLKWFFPKILISNSTKIVSLNPSVFWQINGSTQKQRVHVKQKKIYSVKNIS